IERATQIARAMVTEFGMSDELGPQQLGQRHGEVFLGRDYGHEQNYSDDMAGRIDAEVRRLIAGPPPAPPALRVPPAPPPARLAAPLVERETLDEHELAAIFDGLAPWSGQDTAAD